MYSFCCENWSDFPVSVHCVLAGALPASPMLPGGSRFAVHEPARVHVSPIALKSRSVRTFLEALCTRPRPHCQERAACHREQSPRSEVRVVDLSEEKRRLSLSPRPPPADHTPECSAAPRRQAHVPHALLPPVDLCPRPRAVCRVRRRPVRCTMASCVY